MSFEESRELARRIGEGNRELLERFRLALNDLFQMQVDNKEKPFARKPAIGLRFKLDTNNLVVCAPRFDYVTKKVLCGRQTVELIRQDRIERSGQEMFRPRKILVIALDERLIMLRRWYRNSLADDALSVLTGIQRFLDSPSDLLKDMPNCAICGRVLKDGLSRMRGVGPECIEVVSRWPVYSNRSALASTEAQ